MSQDRPCPKCGSKEVRRVHRKNNQERFISLFGIYPYTCRGCRHHFYRHRRGSAFLLLVAAVWLVSAVLVGGALWSLLGPDTPAKAVTLERAAPRAPAEPSSTQVRASLQELRLAVAALSQEKAALQQSLAQVSRQLAAPAPAVPEPRLAQLEAANLRLRRDLETQRRQLAELRAQKADMQKLAAAKAPQPLPQAAAAPAPTPGLLATVSFGPGRTQLSGQALAALQKAAGTAKGSPSAEIWVEGRADATPLGAATAKLYYDNAGVALARALSVFRALRDLGVDPERMQVRASGAPAKEPDAGRTVTVWMVKSPG
ncbi:MAG: OmpA family protein [Desulfarculaceae bacterium]|nr:OmpA family protein [Desulfarculaceae bacterium]